MKQQPNRVRLTAGRVDDFECPASKAQAFLWDTDSPTLALRVTPTGRKTYVFEARLNGATVRISIGTLKDWPIEDARAKANDLKRLVDQGTDPREVERDRQTAAAEKKADAAAHAVTIGEAWERYIEERRPFWGELNYRDT